MSWLARLKSEIGRGDELPKLTKPPFGSFVSADPPPVLKIADKEVVQEAAQPERLHRLAKLARCPIGFLERLHPDEVAEYALYDDAEVIESLRHLAECRDCRERQTRRVG